MTELTWEGKYDEQGRRVAPLRVTLPFQTIEAVNESAQQRQRTLDLFSAGPDTDEDETTSFVKEPSVIEQKAYRDTWGRGLDSYLQWTYDTAVFLRDLLHETGCVYIHVDWRVAHYVKVVMDEVFGYQNFMADIIWKRIASGRKGA